EGEALHNWLELVRRVAKNHQTVMLSYSSFGHTVLSPGEDTQVFKVTWPTQAGAAAPGARGAPPPPARRAGMPVQIPAAAKPSPAEDPLPNDELCAGLVRAIRKMSVSICYCSTLNDCWTLEDGPEHGE